MNEQRVRELAACHGDPVVTSLYLDVDGRRSPRRIDYEQRFTALCHAAKQQAAGLSPRALAAVEADLARIRGWLDSGFDRGATRGLAFFSSGPHGWFEAMSLPVAVQDRVRVRPEPDLSQLLELFAERQRVLAVAVDRREGRLVRVELGAAEEVARIVDELERQVDTDVELGSWEHRREEAARRHFRRVGAAVLDEVRGGNVDALVVCGPEDATAALRSCLDEAVVQRIVATLPLPVTAATDEIEAAVRGVMQERVQSNEAALAARLEEGAHQRRAVLGLREVLAALAEHRVATLVVGRGFEATGTRCPACGHVGVAACQCPDCGTPSVDAGDIVGTAVDLAVAEGADVAFCEPARARAFGGIGALVRY